MKRLILLVIPFMLAAGLFSQEIMKTSEIKNGMEGIGKTIYKGTKIETFTFKVLGILKNTLGPGKDIIWAELVSPILEETGVMEGMSGSPLYIDGKLIGAVAFGFNFSKKPIAGITPIEDILKTSDYNNPVVSIDISNIKIEFDKKNIQKIATLIQDELAKRCNFPGFKNLSPIKLIPSNQGISPEANTFFKPVAAQSVTLKESPQLKKQVDIKDMLKISPADAVAVPLIRGDFEMAFTGTVTHVDGKNIYIFGHPLFNMGSIDFPLHKAEVITVFPSYQSSFKMAAMQNQIGAVVQDRTSAVQGELGRIPYMIPINVFLRNRNKKFKMEIINNPLMSPALAMIAVQSIFSSEYQDVGYKTINAQGKIFIENESNIVIEDVFTGDNAAFDFGGLVLAANFFVMNNKEKNVKIQKMDFEISFTEATRRTDIVNVIIDKNTYSPGEDIAVSILLKNERGSSRQEDILLKAPNLRPGSEFYLMVADREEITQLETKNIKTPYFPIKLNPLIKAINNLRKNNRIYFRLMTESRGLYIKGYEYSNLPLSMQNVFNFNSKSDVQSNIKYSTLMEYQLEVPSVVKGSKLFKLRIKER